MKLTELMQGKTPNPDFEGFSTADDTVLAIGFTGDIRKYRAEGKM